MGMILVGMTAFMMQKPSGTDYMWSLLMPVGLGFSMAPILNNPSYFGMIFPVTMLVHSSGVMMITGISMRQDPLKLQNKAQSDFFTG